MLDWTNRKLPFRTFIRLHELGMDVGSRLIDLYFVREQNSKRETKLINMLLFVKTTLWKCLFGKEAEKLEHANDDDRTYYIIEKEPLVNKFISVPKDKGSLNCATFTAGLVEAVLTNCGFVSVTLSVCNFVCDVYGTIDIPALQGNGSLAQGNHIHGEV